MPHGFAHHPSLPGGASFILWLQCGRLVTLEGFTNHGEWPGERQRLRWRSVGLPEPAWR